MEIKRREITNWQQVKEMAKAGESELHVGDEILDTLKDGQKITYEVAHITAREVHFISKDCLPDSVAWNEYGETTGGFKNSSLCRYLNTEVWEKLPAELRAVIDEKVCFQIMYGEEEHFPLNVWLPTEYEVYGDTLASEEEREGEQFEIFKDRRNRIKGAINGERRAPWWLLSGMSGDPSYARYVGTVNFADSHVCFARLRVPVCFTIRK